MSEFIKRSFNFEIRSSETEDNKKVITGKPIVFDTRTNLGDFDEVIDAGALDNADLTDVRFLINHDVSKIPLARYRAGDENSTMKLSVEKDCVPISLELDTENNTDARALYSAVQRGDVSGMSFMFTIEGEEWENRDSNHPTRHIKSIGKVLEVSAVTFPAYESTEISARDKTALKNVNGVELEKLKAKYLYNI